MNGIVRRVARRLIQHEGNVTLTNLLPRIATLDVRTAIPAAKKAEPFYLTPAWRKLIAEIIEKRGRICQHCGKKGCRIFGDHVEELKDGGEALDESNVELLCGGCHTRKTAKARAARMQAPALSTT